MDMGSILRKKKKGRPPKADLAARSAPENSNTVLRRSSRRRNVRYSFDIDDYLDDDEFFIDEEDDDEEESRREKKLKHLLKIDSTEGCADLSQIRKVSHAPLASGSSSDFGNGGNPSNKLKFEENDGCGDDGDKVGGRKVERRTDGVPLPDMKTLESILNKLQKKDIYGVYAEPVDPEELPDYHDIIEHPMDFQTVRNKLGNRSYSNLDQLESDIFLICSNAMQYNESHTVYYKQARSIQELAKKKFEKLRFKFERTEQKPIPITAEKKVSKKPIGCAVHNPIGSDFFSGATLVTAADFHLGDSERPSPIERNYSAIDNSTDKEEPHLGKTVSRSGRKPTVLEESRRATYSTSSQPVVNLDSIFTTFDGGSKQLVPVGLYADYSYARSLARFAANLGPVAWKVASRRIEQALPPGCKFGPGWVGEYEEMPNPVWIPEKYTPKEPAFLSKFKHTAAEFASMKDSPVKGANVGGRLPYFSSAGREPAADSTPYISINSNELPGKGNFAFQSFGTHRARVGGTEAQFPVFTQLGPADLSRLQAQSSRQNLNAPAPPRPRQKRDPVPPDLNISFQSSRSPGRPSGALVDSQQPDLALQL